MEDLKIIANEGKNSSRNILKISFIALENLSFTKYVNAVISGKLTASTTHYDNWYSIYSCKNIPFSI